MIVISPSEDSYGCFDEKSHLKIKAVIWKFFTIGLSGYIFNQMGYS